MQYNATTNGSRNVIFQLIISDIFLIFAPTIDCGCCLIEAVLTSTHNISV